MSLGVLLLAGALWYSLARHSEGIAPYDPARDRSEILSIFTKDWYWMVSDYSGDFTPEYMLDNRASSREPLHKGDLTIRVFLIDGKPVGFVTYLTKELLEGKILHLGVDRAYRSKRVGRQLMTYALDDLKKRGSRLVRLMTRVDNAPARKLYTSLGFKEIWTDGAYLKYEKTY